MIPRIRLSGSRLRARRLFYFLSIGFAGVFVLFVWGRAEAIESDLKVTGTVGSSFFPWKGKGGQDDLAATAQIKPDLGIFFGESFQAILAPRFRIGMTDPEYHLISLDDVYVEAIAERFEFRVGYQTFFWGTVESTNIVDILNQRDYTGDFLDPDKLGEPSARARILLGESRWDLFLFPSFTRAPLPGEANRFNFFDGSMEISENPIYTGGAGRYRQQFAARWERSILSADVGLAYFNGYEKFPILYMAPDETEAGSLYYEMQQISADLQMSLGSWLIKGEALYQNTGIADSVVRDAVLPDGSSASVDLVPDNHSAFVAGWEYTFFGLIGQSDLGVFSEYLYDSEQSADAITFRPFQNDVFGGFRWSRNNQGEAEWLAGLMWDVKHGTQLWRIEYSERYFERFNLSARMDLIHAKSPDPLAVFNNDDRLSLKIAYTY
jgi:hypothetical protein